jgi:hypothetical protein
LGVFWPEMGLETPNSEVFFLPIDNVILSDKEIVLKITIIIDHFMLPPPLITTTTPFLHFVTLPPPPPLYPFHHMLIVGSLLF